MLFLVVITPTDTNLVSKPKKGPSLGLSNRPEGAKRQVITMKKRVALSGKKSRKLFTATASKTHKKNLNGNPMRGGIRL